MLIIFKFQEKIFFNLIYLQIYVLNFLIYIYIKEGYTYYIYIREESCKNHSCQY